MLAFSYPGSFRPDAVLSLAHSVAIFDAVRDQSQIRKKQATLTRILHAQSYAKYSNVFRLVAPAGRQYLFQAHDGEELNSWVHAINFAASFKSAGIKIRPLSPAFPGQTDIHRSTPPSNSLRSSLGASVPAPGASRLVRSQGQDSLTASVGVSSSRRSVLPRRPTSPAGQNARLRIPGQSTEGSISATADGGGLPSLSSLNPVTLSQVLDASPVQAAAPTPLTARAESLRVCSLSEVRFRYRADSAFTRADQDRRARRHHPDDKGESAGGPPNSQTPRDSDTLPDIDARANTGCPAADRKASAAPSYAVSSSPASNSFPVGYNCSNLHQISTDSPSSSAIERSSREICSSRTENRSA